MFTLTTEEKRLLLEIARTSIQARGRRSALADFTIPEKGPLRSRHGAFVTLTHEGELRGCIGQIDSRQPLYELIYDMAYEASCHDTRFQPVAPDELQGIDIEISALTPTELVEDIEAIRPGIDGLIIEGKGRRGLLLPQVAERRDWDAITFLENTCWKAGLSRDAWRDGNVRIYRFQAYVFSESDLQQQPEVE